MKVFFLFVLSLWVVGFYDFDNPMNRRVKIKENEEIDKYLDLAKELKKLWNMKLVVILIVVGALETIPKRLRELEITGRIETI